MLRAEERTVLARLDAPVLAIGDDGLIAHVAPAALRALGWDASLVGHPMRDLVPSSRMARYREAYGQLALGRWPSQGLDPVRTFLGQDGKERALHSQVAAFRRPDGSRFLCATFSNDPKQADLDRLDLALQTIGYKRLTPAMH